MRFRCVTGDAKARVVLPSVDLRLGLAGSSTSSTKIFGERVHDQTTEDVADALDYRVAAHLTGVAPRP
jgi:hypothetical protein